MNVFKKIREILSWPEMSIFWIAAALIVVLFMTTYGTLDTMALLIHTALLFALAAIVFWSMYKAAKVERENKVERNELQDTFFKIEDPLIVYDNDFKVSLFNPAAEKLFGVRSDAVVSHKFQPQDVTNPPLRLLAQVIFPSLAPSVTSLSKSGEYPQMADVSFSDPSLDFRVSTYLVQGKNGTPMGFMKIIRDRTREMSLIKSKTEFLTIASHELRTPVTELNWAVESLVADATLSDSSRAIVENAAVSARQLKEIVEDLLSIAKIEEGHFGYVFEEVNIIDFIEKILSEITPLARKSGIKVYFEKPKSALHPVFIDSSKLSIAVSDLLENAVRYNIENGEVVMKVEQQKDKKYIEISISDTGIGIPPADIGKLFTKFFRAENVMKSQAEGSGLGLYITKNIIQGHGGQIWVDSELGRGATFHFTLPTDPELIPKHEVAIW